MEIRERLWGHVCANLHWQQSRSFHPELDSSPGANPTESSEVQTFGFFPAKPPPSFECQLAVCPDGRQLSSGKQLGEVIYRSCSLFLRVV